MKIAFNSDPHADLVALLAVIFDMERQIISDEALVGGDPEQGGPPQQNYREGARSEPLC
jgi:hypothetical protein